MKLNVIGPSTLDLLDDIKSHRAQSYGVNLDFASIDPKFRKSASRFICGYCSFIVQDPVKCNTCKKFYCEECSHEDKCEGAEKIT